MPDQQTSARPAEPAIGRLRAAIDAIAAGKPAHLMPDDLCAVLHEAEAAQTMRAAAQGALALIEIIDAVEVKAAPVSDLSPTQLGDLLNNTERALREALAT